MKIVHISPNFLPIEGGVEIYVYNLSKELVKMGHKVSVLTSHILNTKRYEKIDGINVFRIPILGKLFTVPIMPSLFRESLKMNADILHGHLPHPIVFEIAVLSHLVSKTPLVLTIQNLTNARVVGSSQKLKMLISELYSTFLGNFSLSFADQIITTTQQYIQSFRTLRRIQNKITVIPNGVDIQKFSPNSTHALKDDLKLMENKIILFVGLLRPSHKYKGLDYLLNAMKLVIRHVPNAKLLIVGGGKLQAYYEALCGNLGLTEYVSFVGSVPHSSIDKYYNIADVFVLPSINQEEGFGIVILEAMACKKPVIVTSIAGVSEIISNEEVGYIVPPKNHEVLANAIIKILSKDNLAGLMGQNARNFVKQKCNWTEIAKQTLLVYKDVLNKK